MISINLITYQKLLVHINLGSTGKSSKLTVKCPVKYIYIYIYICIYIYNCYTGNVQDMAGTLSRQGPKMVKETEKKNEKKWDFLQPRTI